RHTPCAIPTDRDEWRRRIRQARRRELLHRRYPTLLSVYCQSRPGTSRATPRSALVVSLRERDLAEPRSALLCAGWASWNVKTAVRPSSTLTRRSAAAAALQRGRLDPPTDCAPWLRVRTAIRASGRAPRRLPQDCERRAGDCAAPCGSATELARRP